MAKQFMPFPPILTGAIIGEAGKRKLSIPELEHLQAQVIKDSRFIEHGLRKQGGFAG